MTVNSPYNFVPLPEDVFFPSWAEQISQDVPFCKGLDGTIKLTITARTPIFIRNGYSGDDKDNTFSHTPDGKYFIPATTVKSCIRSVLEIMSFGKMKPVTKEVKGYRNSPESLETDRQARSAQKQQTQRCMDLAECIFGMTSDNVSLRGRVQFSNFMCTKPVSMPQNKAEMIYVLNSPNPACLPMYVQSDGEKYYDYNSKYAEEIMNGWKRYILKQRADLRGKDHETRTTSTLQPLNSGSIFEGKIRFHNLLPEELGALLCAITWNNEKDCCHQIGQAKPYGYGQVQISIDPQTAQTTSAYIKQYKEMMKQWLVSLKEDETPWRNTYSVYELFTLASYKAAANDRRFQYMRSDDLRARKKEKASLSLLNDILDEKD